jgi:phage terminase large subunit-like protein
LPRKKKVDLEKSAIAEYWHQIDSGAIVTCNEIRTVYQHLYKKLYDTKIDGYHYDWQLAHRPVDFIATFCHLPKLRGNPLCQLDLWQQAMVESIFGFVDDNNNRQYSEVFFTVARKQGKSALAAMIALYLLIGDGEAEPELYCIATKKDQSKIIWEMAGQIMSKSPELRKYLKKRVGDISCNLNNGLFKPLASDSNSLDGLNASVVLADELHSWKDSNLYDVMVDSMVARTQPLFLITTTAGFVRAGIYDQKVDEYEMIIAGYDDPDGYKDPRRLPIIYKLDSEKEWTDSSCWIKANPGLGTIRPLDKLAEDVERARHNPQKVPDLLTKFFDLPQNGIDHFLTIEELTNKKTFAPSEQEIKYAIGGFDLSETTDLTSTVLMYQLPNDPTYYVLTMSWMPEELYEKHIATDHVPYDIWRQRGWLRLCPGNQIDYHMVADWFSEIKNKYHLTIYRIGYDRYGASYMTDEMAKKFGQLCMIPVAQNAMTLSIPLQNMRAEFQRHHINYQNNQLMKWCLGNLMVTRDAQGNYNTTKNRNDHIRDDAAMALLDAFCAYFQVYEKYTKLINK